MLVSIQFQDLCGGQGAGGTERDTEKMNVNDWIDRWMDG